MLDALTSRRSGQVATAQRLKVHQDALAGSIRKLGGTVEAKYQYVYNGLKLRIPSGKLNTWPAAGREGDPPVRTYSPTTATACRSSALRRCGRTSAITGNGQTIAVIDTGIDYTTRSSAARAPRRLRRQRPDIVEPGTFPTAKVIGGWDFVGDDYNRTTTTGPRSRRPTPIRWTATATAPT